MNKIRLGVNIDHVATVKTQVIILILSNSITSAKSGLDCNNTFREDRRHVNEKDLKLIKSIENSINLEIAATKEMMNIALKKHFCLYSSEKERNHNGGGLNLFKKFFKDYK